MRKTIHRGAAVLIVLTAILLRSHEARACTGARQERRLLLGRVQDALVFAFLDAQRDHQPRRPELWHVTVSLEQWPLDGVKAKASSRVGHFSLRGARWEQDAPVMIRAALALASRAPGFLRAPVPRTFLCEGKLRCGGVLMARLGRDRDLTGRLTVPGSPGARLEVPHERLGYDFDRRDPDGNPMPGLVSVLRYHLPGATILVVGTGESTSGVSRRSRQWYGRGCRTLESCTPPDRTQPHSEEYSHVIVLPSVVSKPRVAIPGSTRARGAVGR